METTLKDSRTHDHSDPEPSDPRTADEMKDAMGRMENDFAAAKASVSEALDEGRLSAERLLWRGRNVAEDCLEQATDEVMRKPGTAVALAFGVGVIAGVAFGWAARRSAMKRAPESPRQPESRHPAI